VSAQGQRGGGREAACERQRDVAYHEAGHAVVASAWGFDVEGCWTDGDGGATHSRPPQEMDVGLRSIGQLAEAFAGACAEAILHDDAAPEDRLLTEMNKVLELTRGYSDREAVEWLRERPGVLHDADVVVLLPADDEQASGALGFARDLARKLLRDEWADVEAIAACLGSGARGHPGAGVLRPTAQTPSRPSVALARTREGCSP